MIIVGGQAGPLRVDDERAVHAPGDVLGQRADVAVVAVQPERLGGELIGRGLPGRDHPGPVARHPVHLRRMDPVKVHGVRVFRAVGELHPQVPSVQRNVGPGMRESNVQAANRTPRATSMSSSLANTSHSRSTRPSGSVDTFP